MNRLQTCLIGALLLGLPLAAGAQSADPNAPSPVTPSQDEATQDEQAAKPEKAVDHFCLRNTGSHITAHRANRARRCAAYGRVYDYEALQRTGEIDVADALRKLDPSIH